MRSLSDLLKNHPIPGIRQSETRRICSEVIQTMIGIPIAPGKIRLQNGILSLSLPPVVKSAVLVRQGELLMMLKEQEIQITEIR